MNRFSKSLGLSAVVLLLTTHRLPAPIQEVLESPTPAPEQSAKPKNVQWQPESFTLRFAEDGKRGAYECHSEGRPYTAELSPP